MALLRAFLRPLLTVVLLSVSAAVSAVVVDNLHRALVDVEDHGSRQLSRATREGLAQVLVKVSGDRAVLQYDAVKRALGQSQKYMQRYQYLRPEGGGLKLQMHFDPRLVNDLLRDAGAPLWTANRPPVLIWLVAEDGGGRHFVNRDSNPVLMAALTEQLERRGVPAVFPLYDLEDTVSVSLHDLWQLDRLAVGRASQRYGVANILVGRVTSLPGERWMGDWVYLSNQDSSEDSYYGRPTADFSARAVDLVADSMAARFAVAGEGGSEPVLVRVDAITSYSDYRRVLEVLESIELVDSAWPAYLEGESVVFRLSARADAAQLERIIALDRRLQPLDSVVPLERGPLNLELGYQWSP